jgi:CubicO group peptidase (beta-lactamase class C family)
MRRSALLVVASLAIVGVVPAHASTGSSDSALGKRLEAILAKTSGSAVAIAVRNRSIVAEVDRDADAFMPLHLASISKTITAVAVLRLAQQNRIELDRPIGSYIPSLFAADEAGKSGNDAIADQPVSAFLNHATGLRSQNLRAVGSGLTSYAEYARQAARSGLTSNPGSYRYANDNYVLLTMLVETVARRSFEVAIQQLVWDKLGVPGGWLDTSARATQVLGGAGAWVASPFAVAAFFDALNPETPGTKLLSPAWLNYMHTRVYADEYRNGLRYRSGHWGHTGSLARVRSAAVVGDDGTVYVILSEGARPESSDKLFDALARLG